MWKSKLFNQFNFKRLILNNPNIYKIIKENSIIKNQNLFAKSKFYYSIKTKNEMNFLAFCNMINSLEKENSYLLKQEIYTNYIIQNIKIDSNNLKNVIFENIGNIIKLTVPSLFIVDETDSKKLNNEELIRNQYNYQNILERFAKEYFVHKRLKNNDDIKSLEEINIRDIKNEINKFGGVYNFISEIYEIKNQKTNNSFLLSVNDIIKYKKEVNLSIGINSSEVKIKLFKEILDKCSDKLEVYYISRLFTNQMSCGMSTKSIIKCLKNLHKDIGKNNLDSIFFKDLIDYLEEHVFKYSIGITKNSEYNNEIKSSNDFNNKIIVTNKAIESFNIGKYVDLCLCKPGVNLESLIKIIKEKKLQKILLEIKFDGERSQIHFDGKSLKMGSRKFENQINLYKNLYENLLINISEYNNKNNHNQIKNFILDGEIICYSEFELGNTGKSSIKILDFQELRKKNFYKNMNYNIKYIFVAFDIIVYNDISIFKYPIENRKNILHNFFQEKFNSIIVENGKIINCENDENLCNKITNYYNYAKSINCEGLIVKFIGENTEYEFGKRKWLKVYFFPLFLYNRTLKKNDHFFKSI